VRREIRELRDEVRSGRFDSEACDGRAWNATVMRALD
jgi:hypothetical protein